MDTQKHDLDALLLEAAEAEAAQRRAKMHPGYVGWWVGIMAFIVAAEVAGAPRWAWIAVLSLFVVVEGVALARQKAGDTFSELMWTFGREGKHRAPVAVATAVYLSMRFVMLGVDFVPEWLPMTVLSLGLVGWLVPHFVFFGRDG